MITYQDLIAFRIPQVFTSETAFDIYCATSRLVVPAVQRIIAYSESVSREITAEFGIPSDEITVVALAAEQEASSTAPAPLADSVASAILFQPRQRLSPQKPGEPARGLRSVAGAGSAVSHLIWCWLDILQARAPGCTRSRGLAFSGRRHLPRASLRQAASGPLQARPGARLCLSLRRIRPATARGHGVRDAGHRDAHLGHARSWRRRHALLR